MPRACPVTVGTTLGAEVPAPPPSPYARPMKRRFDDDGPLPLIAPSILAADFAHMARDCALAVDAGAEVLHLDVMDGHFVPNLTMGPDMCRALRREFPGVLLDVHLMVSYPQQFFEPFARAGADHLTFHWEPLPEARAADAALEFARDIRDLGLTAGLAINPPTPWEKVSQIAASFDLLLVMSVNPGFGGQGFIGSVLDKTRRARESLGRSKRIEMDGGISAANAADVRHAGCDVLVAGSALFGKGAPEFPRITRELRGVYV